MNIEKYNEAALNLHNEHQKFLKKLKDKKPKKLDEITQQIHNEVFDEVNCLSCANCCKTTGPLFTEIDIERISKHLRMKPGDFADKYLKKDEENDWVLQSVPCSFLDSENYCLIYEVRPKACREFPHTDRKKLWQINNLTIKNVKICPAAFMIVEKMRVNISI